nr:alpha/beta hydrolase [Mangrovicoccus ximenensis]
MLHNLRDSPAEIGTTAYFSNRDGLRLAYRDDGPKDGPVLLCLAGLTRNLADFDFVARDFSDRVRVLRLDTRGRGQSDWDPDYLNYNLIRESHDAIDLLDHLGIARTAILGTSRGGLIAMALAGGHKPRITGVCLNDIGPEIEPEGLAYIGQYLGKRPAAGTYGDAARRFAEVFGQSFPDVPPERWQLHARRIYCDSPDGLDLRYDALLRRSIMEQSATDAIQDLWLLFRALEGLPLALIRGQNSNILSAATAGEMRRRRPDMIYGEVPNRGHVPFLDEPEAQAVISEFLERLT